VSCLRNSREYNCFHPERKGPQALFSLGGGESKELWLLFKLPRRQCTGAEFTIHARELGDGRHHVKSEDKSK
jgi:hypothetical protein